MLQIEKNIPVKSRYIKVYELPVDKMEIGDSVLVPLNYRGNEKCTKTFIQGTVSMYRKKVNPNFKHTIHTSEEGIRIWRLA